jgi:transposase
LIAGATALSRRVRDLQAEAAAHKATIEQLVFAWRPDLLKLTGVGPVVAATILTVWSQPEWIGNEAAFAILAGVARVPPPQARTPYTGSTAAETAISTAASTSSPSNVPTAVDRPGPASCLRARAGPCALVATSDGRGVVEPDETAELA